MSKISRVRKESTTIELPGETEDGEEEELTFKIPSPSTDHMGESMEIMENDGEIEGMIHLVYLTLQREYPDVEKQEIKDMDFSHVKEIVGKINEQAGMEDAIQGNPQGMQGQDMQRLSNSQNTEGQSLQELREQLQNQQ